MKIHLLTKLWVRTLHHRISLLSCVFFPEWLYEARTAITSSSFPLFSLYISISLPLLLHSLSFLSHISFPLSSPLSLCHICFSYNITLIASWGWIFISRISPKEKGDLPPPSVRKVPGRTPLVLPQNWEYLNLNTVLKYRCYGWPSLDGMQPQWPQESGTVYTEP